MTTALGSTAPTTIQRLRVLHSGRDPLTARLRTASRLEMAVLQPAGLPPAAILYVRHLRDPLPGKMAQPGHLGPAQRWVQAVVTALDRLAQQAARPLHAPVPATAEAVLFADRAELLAGLALDWLAGSVTTHWWWQGLLRGTDLGATLVQTWLDAPVYVPVALAHLAERRQATTFVRRLPAGGARQLAQNLAGHFAPPALQRAVDTIFARAEFTTQPTIGRATIEDPVQNAVVIAVGTPIKAPWHDRVPEADESGLAAEQQILLGLGLLLQRAPATLRNPAFAQTMQTWCDQRQHSAALARRQTTTLAHSPIFRPAHRGVDDPVSPAANNKSLTPEPLSVLDRSRLMANRTGSDETVVMEQPGVLQLASLPSQPAASITPVAVAGDALQTPDVPAGFATEAGEQPPSVFDCLFESQIDTQFGGVFYLINLGLFLELYGDFTTPLDAGMDLPLWDFVALLARQLAGTSLVRDPVWPLLARLAGRAEGEAPGHAFMPPAEWRLPLAWLAAFPTVTAWRWSTGDERLRLHHPGGFLVLDIPLVEHDPAEQLAAELQAYPPAKVVRQRTRRSSQATIRGDCPSPLDRWLAWLMPYVRARLRRALALSSRRRGDLWRLLCVHPARVYVTATHVDVVLSLADLPIAVRLAGLDRDPWWVPAANRIIAFHFE